VRLKGAESEVNLAAVETLGTQADRVMLSRIERASERIRQAGAQRIFQPTN
jgi:hypothetical protein